MTDPHDQLIPTPDQNHPPLADANIDGDIAGGIVSVGGQIVFNAPVTVNQPSATSTIPSGPPNSTLDVFVSSKMLELAPERKALYELIPKLGQGLVTLRPWVFEFTAPASEKSIRETYLKYLKGSALYIGLFWNAHGEWTIDEFERAAEWQIDRHIYVKNVDNDKRDAKLTKFLKKHSDVTSGLTHKWFTSIEDLCEAVKVSVEAWIRDYLPGRRGAQSAILAKKDNLGALEAELAPKLIGREELIADVQAKLDQHRNVLLQGFGGMGKTVLAAKIAVERIANDQGPVLWLHAGVETADALFEALAKPFDAQHKIASAPGDKATVLHDLLVESGVKLLVLDNVWNDRALARVMQAIPLNMSALVTSRTRYPLSRGEIIEISELTPTKALELLSYHAQHDYSADPKAGELCKKLGYHALALEIAGKTLWIDRLLPAELLERTVEALVTMKIPSDYAKEGRESVAALIEVSRKALSDDAEVVFQIIGAMFAPHVTAALLSLYKKRKEKTVEDALLELQRRGLADRVAKTDDCAAYYRIHDLAFSYARALTLGKKRNRQQALKACRDYAQKYQADFGMLQAERDNLLGAAEAAQRLNQPEFLIDIMRALTVDGAYLAARGYTSLSLDLLKAAIIAAKEKEQLETAHFLLSKLGNVYADFIGDFDSALKAYQEALVLARGLNNTNREAILLSVIGMVRFRQKADDAEQYLEQAYQVATTHHDDAALSIILQHRSYQAMIKDNPDYESGRRFANEASEVAKRLDLHEIHFAALLNRGGCELELKLFDQALATHHQAYEFARRRGNHDWMGVALHSMGEDYDNLGNLVQAQQSFDEALSILQEIKANARLQKLITYMQSKGYQIRLKSHLP